ncbi:EI24 domain-containing protein [Carboxylicivirga sediminis]|uniref:EI24 domain-containing protein n=1 Tax=Carboxylicivirga sediminis TaxID=2006564 RepID=A0A941F3U3_9BACT|nr:EI24 domain-containing protein [Carboxylicivirga sediminis]MBR8536328.1 EI24 domain-containing protein [Carboxylicivirga sediminis]
MNYRQGFQLGLRTYSQAMSFMFRNRLGWFFIFPVLFNVLLFIGGFYSVSSLSDGMIESLNEWMNIESWDFWGASAIVALIKGLIWIVLRLLFFIIYAYIGGYVILILLSPVFAYLSEKTEEVITGNKLPFDFIQFAKDILRGVLLAIRNLTVELLFTVLLFILSFIPLVGYFTPVALFLVSAYFYGFSFLDYTFERRRLQIDVSVRLMRKNKGLAIGNGFVFSLVLLIPYIGVMVAGFVAIISVVAATLAAAEVVDKELELIR